MHDGITVPPPPRRATRGDAILAVALLAALLAAYFPALRGAPLLDDEHHLTRPELRSFSGLARIWTDVGATQQYYPVLHTAFWIEHRVWGDAVVGYHLLNVLLHAGAALLVVAIVRELGLRGGWLAGFLFALHPLAVESVAWIAEQKNTLSAVFGLGAMLAYLRFTRERRAADYLWATALFIFALLSKTAMVIVPIELAVIAWWRHGKLEWRRDLRPLVPWIAAAVVAGLITLRLERTLIAGINAQFGFSWLERALSAARATWFYLGKAIWPARLSFLYERWSPDAHNVWWFSFTARIAAIAGGLTWLVRRTRGPLAGFLVFTVALLPVLGFVNVEWFVFSFVADHFAYLAILGMIIPLATLMAPHADRPAARGAIAGILALLGGLTWRHSADFRDDIALYSRAVVVSPDSVVARHHLGVALAKIPERRIEAVAAFESALRFNPTAAEVHEDLGGVLLQMPGRMDDALAHLETALQLKPGLASVRRQLAGAYFDRAKSLAAEADLAAAAIEAYGNALRVDPNFTEAHYNLANLLLRDPRQIDAAIAHYEAAVRLKPDFAEAHTNLGTVLARQGRLPEAVVHFESALRANPNFAPARNNLRNAQRQLDRTVTPQR